MFRKLLLLLVMIPGFLVIAQGQSKKDAAAALLQEVTDKTKSYQTIKILFTYKMDNPQAKVHESQDGELHVKGDQYRLIVAGQVVICDGKTIWTYIKDANEIQINAVEEDKNAITPTKLLTSYSSDYKSRLTGEENKGGKVIQLVELKPIEEKNYTRVELKVDKDLKQIQQIAIFDKSDNTFTYIMKEFLPNVQFKATEFTYVPTEFPGAEVIDMR
jgi:outer membrane lipoprotein-sorting protein